VVLEGDMDKLKAKIIPRRSLETIPLEKIKEDLKKYQTMAVEMGAAAAEIIPSNEIIIDERVRAKCIIPNCIYYGKSINCPPHAPDLDFFRKFIGRYHYGILFSVRGETKDLIDKDRKRSRENRLLSSQISTEIESTAFYEGYYFSLALGEGPCKSFWCPDQPCAGLQLGTGCRFPLKARMTMDAAGIDVFKMASHYGWEIYPCGERVDIENLPHMLRIGLVLIY
jgi:predicted metal-binding protein